MSKKFEVFRLETSPSKPNRVVELTHGDQIYIVSPEPVSLGGQYKDYDNTIISRIDYMPRKWWQFWKKKFQIGYVVTMK